MDKERLVAKVAEEVSTRLHTRLDDTKAKMERDLKDIRQDMVSLRQDVNEMKQNAKSHGANILDKALTHLCKSSPDYWSITIGPVVVSFRGFTDVSKESTKKLIEDIKQGGWPEAIKPFIEATAPTSIEIELEGSLYSSVARAGIAWGYENPGKKTDDIIELIKSISSH